MKLIKQLIIILLTFPMIMSAQISKPNLSPRVVSEQQVGMVNVKLDYGQPNRQNREIFGELIPFNKIWRTGANSSTKISFDREVKLADHVIPSGTYGLYSIPEENQWTIIIHKNSSLWGAGGYDPTNDLVRFVVPVTQILEPVETLSIHFEDFDTNGGDMVIAWENSKVVIPLFVDSDEIIFNEIAEKTSSKNETISAQTYFDAAQFYYLKKTKLDTAMLWFDKAIEMKPNAYWYIYYKAELAYHMENFSLAKENAEKCLASAESSPSTDYGYIAKSKLLLKQIAESDRK
jgi:tetratricopeptide (TPR) repeat protein